MVLWPMRRAKYLVVAVDLLVAWLRDASVVAAETGLAIQVGARVALTVEFLQPHLLVLQRSGTSVRKRNEQAHNQSTRHTHQRKIAGQSESGRTADCCLPREWVWSRRFASTDGAVEAMHRSTSASARIA